MACVSMGVCPRQVGSVPPGSQLRIHTTFTSIQCSLLHTKMQHKTKIQNTKAKKHSFEWYQQCTLSVANLCVIIVQFHITKCSVHVSHVSQRITMYHNCVLRISHVSQCTIMYHNISQCITIAQCACHMCHTVSFSPVKGCHT